MHQPEMDTSAFREYSSRVTELNETLKSEFKHASHQTDKDKSTEFDEPWRIMPWWSKDNLKGTLRNFELSVPNVKHVRILVAGEVGAGKSSFINSVNNVFQERITSDAPVDATSGTSFTKVYKTYYIRGKDGSRLPFVFNDIMGLEPEASHGAHVQDIISALKGFLKEGYTFDPVCPVSPNDYKNNTSFGDQTFCLVIILTADKLSLLDQKVIKKMKLIRNEAAKMNLPQVIILTKVDEACPLVKKDIRKVYTSKKIKEKMEKCSNLLGVPMSHIFPVKNYHEEVDTDDCTDVLILKALEQILNLASDALKTQLSCENQFDKPWRIMPWGDAGELKRTLMNFELSISHVEHVKILIIGEVGAGKSSFINSVNNVLQERITSDALVAAASGTSFTKVYKTHCVTGKDGSRLPFVFNDIMGLEPENSHGAHVQDIVSALKGFLEEGYKFNPDKPLSKNDPYYKRKPNFHDQTFCLVYVLAADSLSHMDQRVIKKMKIIHEEASQLNLPQVTILTKVDEACLLVQKDIRKVYTSKKIKDEMQECSDLLGIPMSHIFPVKNYTEEVDSDATVDILILKALEQIVNLANDALKSQTSNRPEGRSRDCICPIL